MVLAIVWFHDISIPFWFEPPPPPLEFQVKLHTLAFETPLSSEFQMTIWSFYGTAHLHKWVSVTNLFSYTSTRPRLAWNPTSQLGQLWPLVPLFERFRQPLQRTITKHVAPHENQIQMQVIITGQTNLLLASKCCNYITDSGKESWGEFKHHLFQCNINVLTTFTRGGC